MKFCTFIAYYITSVSKQFKFLNPHCSFVYSYCSVSCLIAKKVIKFSSSFKLNEIYKVDSPFNEDLKNIFFREALILGEGRPEILGKMGNNRDIHCYLSGGGEFVKSMSAPTPWYQNPCDASISLHVRPNFRKK